VPRLDRVGHLVEEDAVKAEATGTIRKTDSTSISGTTAQLAASSIQVISPIQGSVTTSGTNQPTTRRRRRRREQERDRQADAEEQDPPEARVAELSERLADRPNDHASIQVAIARGRGAGGRAAPRSRCRCG
jgi:hypothetical protein